MKKPEVIEVFNDDGSHSHWKLISVEMGKELWSEDQHETSDDGLRNSTEKRQALSAKLNEINDPELTQLVQDAQLELMRESEKATADPA